MIKSIIIASVLVFFCASSSSSAAEWYETLCPGTTHAEILKLAGTPSKSVGNTDTYLRQKGRIECTYDGDILQGAVYFDPPGGAVSWTLYTIQGESKESDLELRRSYLKAGSFAVLPMFSGKKIFTNKYSGACYEVDGGFIVTDPIISLMGGEGFFADKAAQVLWLKPDGKETILYRARDHWKALKPPELSEVEVRNRSINLKKAADDILITNMANMLGKCDSRMGSGMDYQLFYLEDGLAMLPCSIYNGTIKSISILRPGISSLTLNEWRNAASH